MNKAVETDLHLDPQWLNAIHYKKSLLGSFSSEADSPTFFFSKNGVGNPKDEFKATFHALLQPIGKDINEHPQCKFPTRTRILKRLFPSLKNELNLVCPDFEKFRNKLSARAVSLVFSSYFLDTPASAFGHTLMRFSKHEDPKKGEAFELLDNAINYSANVTTDNALIYGLLGLTGGFKGEFASMPYFYKVREYNDFESRDIWDYHLDLSTDQIETIVTHVWEMKQTFFSYWYLTENCSYHMLSLLDVANPDWKLTERNPYFVVPVDTIQTVVETPGLLKSVRFRPSKRREVKNRLNSLNKEERKIFDQLAVDFSATATKISLAESSKTKIYDAAIDFLDYKFAEDILMNDSAPSDWKRKFLIARSKIPIKSEKIKIPLPVNEQPQIGHKTRRISIGGGSAKESDDFALLEYRFALHDFLDSTIGHNKDAWMEMGNLKLRYHPKVESKGNSSMLRVDEFSLFHVVSLSPLEQYFSTMSWTARVGSKTVKDKGCDFCFTPMMRVGGGLSQDFGSIVYYALLSSEGEIWKDISRRGYRFGVGPEGGIILRLADSLKAHLKGEYFRRFFTDHKWTYEYSGSMRYEIIKNHSFESGYSRFEREWEYLAKYLVYF